MPIVITDKKTGKTRVIPPQQADKNKKKQKQGGGGMDIAKTTKKKKTVVKKNVGGSNDLNKNLKKAVRGKEFLKLMNKPSSLKKKPIKKKK